MSRLAAARTAFEAAWSEYATTLVTLGTEVGRIETMLREGAETVGSLNESLEEELASAEEAILETKDAATQALDLLQEGADERMEAMLGETEEVLGVWLESAEELTTHILEQLVSPNAEHTAEELATTLEHFAEVIDGPLSSALTSGLEDQAREAQESVLGAMDELSAGAATFTNGLLQRRDSTQGDRQESSLLTSELEGLLAPVVDALERVRALASSVGVPI